jgi:hypothetical protein
VDGSDFVLWSMSMLIVARRRIGLTGPTGRRKTRDAPYNYTALLRSSLPWLVGWLDVADWPVQSWVPSLRLGEEGGLLIDGRDSAHRPAHRSDRQEWTLPGERHVQMDVRTGGH